MSAGQYGQEHHSGLSGFILGSQWWTVVPSLYCEGRHIQSSLDPIRVGWTLGGLDPSSQLAKHMRL